MRCSGTSDCARRNGLIHLRDPTDIRAVSVLSDSGLDLYERRDQLRGAFHHEHLPFTPGTEIIAAASGTFAAYSYVFDEVQRLRQIDGPNGGEQYNYDALDRLLNYQLPGSVVGSYAYDANGNRTAGTRNGSSQTHTYASTSNRLTQQAGTAVTHNAAGLRTKDQNNNRTFTYN